MEVRIYCRPALYVLTSGLNQAVHAKIIGLHVALCAREIGCQKWQRAVQRLKKCSKSSRLHSKKIFCLGGQIFCDWRHKRRTFRPLWPTLPGPGLKLLDGSFSLKFLLVTRLQSEFFNILDDVLGFWVQKSWSKQCFSTFRKTVRTLVKFHSHNQ